MSDWDFGGAYAGTEAQLQQTQQSAQRFPLDMAHLAATTRLNTAYAGIAEHKLESEKNMASIMQGMQFEPGADQSSTVMRMAGAAMKAGDPTTAQSLILHSAQLKTQEVRQAAAEASAAHQKAQQSIKMAERFNGLMNGVHDARTFDQAKFMFEQEFGESAPDVPYSPENVEMLRQSSLKLRDKIYQEHSTAMEKLSAQRLASTNFYKAESLKIRREELERREARDRRLEKEGGKDIGAPSKVEIDQAKDLMEREGKAKGLDGASQRTAAFDLAARARALRKQNPGLSAGEATQRALTEQIAEGYYTTKRASNWYGGTKETQVYGKPGASAERPLDPPMGKDKRPDAAKLKEGSYYKTPKGPLLYLGKGQWQAPQAAAPSSGGGGGAAPESDDEDLDEEE